MERLHVDGRRRGSVAAAGTEYIRCPFLKLRFPRCNLIGVDVELLRKLSQCTIALDGRECHLRLEGRCVVPARSSLQSGRNSTYRPVQISGAGSVSSGSLATPFLFV